MAPFEIDWKGVRTALEAVRLLRDRGIPFRCREVTAGKMRSVQDFEPPV